MMNVDFKIKVLMVDSLVGNDYSYVLSEALLMRGLDLYMVIPEDRIVQGYNDISLLRIMPEKNQKGNNLSKFLKYLSYLKKLFFEVKNQRIDIIHFQFFRRLGPEALFLFLLKTLPVKMVHTVHDVTPLNESLIDRLFKKIVYYNMDLLIVHSESNKESLHQLGIDKNKITVVPHGNFDDLLPDHLITRQDARKKLEIDEKANVVLFFGFIKEYKGLDILLKALEISAKTSNNLALIVAGAIEDQQLKDKYLNEINCLKKSMQIITRFEFIPQQDTQIYFQAADVVILPYKRISHSGVLHLAFSYGRPVIASDVGDFKEIISNESIGLTFIKENHVDLANCIVKIFSSKEKLLQMGFSAKMTNAEKFSWESISMQMKEIYNKLVLK